MGYSRYFGMRSFENVVRDGRFRAPKTGTPLKIGEPVMLDPNNPGFFMPATAALKPNQNCGVAVFEHIQNKSDALTTHLDAPYDQVPLGQYAQVMHGQGAKVWFKNIAAKTLYDGRQLAAGTLLAATLDLTVVKPGDGLVPDGAGKYRADAEATETAWLVIEQVNPATGLVEARFTF